MASNLLDSVDDIGDEIGRRVDPPQSYTDLVCDLLDRNGQDLHGWREDSEYTEMAGKLTESVDDIGIGMRDPQFRSEKSPGVLAAPETEVDQLDPDLPSLLVPRCACHTGDQAWLASAHPRALSLLRDEPAGGGWEGNRG